MNQLIQQLPLSHHKMHKYGQFRQHFAHCSHNLTEPNNLVYVALVNIHLKSTQALFSLTSTFHHDVPCLLPVPFLLYLQRGKLFYLRLNSSLPRLIFWRLQPLPKDEQLLVDVAEIKLSKHFRHKLSFLQHGFS